MRRSERGNLHYDNVAISGDLLAQSQPVTAHALCMNTAQAGAGAGGSQGFAANIFGQKEN